MTTNLFVSVNLVLIVVSFALGIVFLSFPVPKVPGLRNYRISLKILALSYLSMSLASVFLLLFTDGTSPLELLEPIYILMSSVQTMLFGLSLISLLNPGYVKKKLVLKHFSPTLSLVGLYLLALAFTHRSVIYRYSDIPAVLGSPVILLRMAMLVWVVFQLFFYTRLFLKEEKRYKNRVNNYFSDAYRLQLGWVRSAFIASLFVGVFSLFVGLFPYRVIDLSFTVFFAVFYLFFAVEYIQYPKVYYEIAPVIDNQLPQDEILVEKIIEPIQEKLTPMAKNGRLVWGDFREQILEQKIYLEPGINIEDLAFRLKIGRTTLSGFINSEEGMNFNTWINSLRIIEAKKLFTQHPNLSIAEVSDMVGYKEQSNFSRQFKLIIGETPLLWKQKNLKGLAV
jgi:AraC-like DNA-binding protein